MISLKNLEEATAQAAFDQIVSHLRAQGEPCGDKDDICIYKNGNKRCAAGCLIADDEYKDYFETENWLSLISSCNITDAHCYLIFAMQQIHDIDPVSAWEKSFKSVAERFSLVYTAPA